jgi:hypothetical protein
MILVIISIIAAVGGTSMYISSRWKKYSILLKRAMRMSWLAMTSFAACFIFVLQYRYHTTVKDTDREENTDARKYYARW